MFDSGHCTGRVLTLKQFQHTLEHHRRNTTFCCWIFSIKFVLTWHLWLKSAFLNFWVRRLLLFWFFFHFWDLKDFCSVCAIACIPLPPFVSPPPSPTRPKKIFLVLIFFWYWCYYLHTGWNWANYSGYDTQWAIGYAPTPLLPLKLKDYNIPPKTFSIML